MSLSRPLARAGTGFARASPVQCLIQQRRNAQRAAMGQKIVSKEPRGSNAPASMKTSLSGNQAANMPKDLGMLPYTYIYPPPERRPAVFSKERMMVEYYRAKYGIMKWIEVAMFRWKAKMPVAIKEPTVDEAQRLYKGFYEAFAKGDVDTLRDICGHGLLTTTLKRLYGRSRLETVGWKLDGFQNRADGGSSIRDRIRGMLGGVPGIERVSNRGLHYWGQNVDMRQAVFRVKSKQSVITYVNGKPTSDGTSQFIEEYMVLQKRRMLDMPTTQWYIWGFLGKEEEASLRKIAEIKAQIEALKELALRR